MDVDALAPVAAPYPVLYSFRRCPYAMRARLALAASGTVCELREVVLARKPPALLQVSPKGTVPALVLPDGAVLEQSLDIMRRVTATSRPTWTATNTRTATRWPMGWPIVRWAQSSCSYSTPDWKLAGFCTARTGACLMLPSPRLCASLPTPTRPGLPASPGLLFYSG